MAASAQNPRSFRVGGRPGGMALPGAARVRASRSLWLALGLTVLATAVASVSAVAIVRERAALHRLSVMREGMDLLEVERAVSLAGYELITATTMHMYDGKRSDEVGRRKEIFRRSLVSASKSLAGHPASESWRPIWERMVTAVDGALDGFDRPRTYSELIAWGDEFLYDFKLVRAPEHMGEWSALIEVATWTEEAALVPRDYLDMALARVWAIDGRPPADSLLLGNFQFSLAAARQIVDSHGTRAVSFSPFEETLLVDRARDAGPEPTAMLRAMAQHPAIVQINSDYPFLLGLSGERSFDSIDQLYEQIIPFMRDISAAAEPVGAYALQRIEEARTDSEFRDQTARFGGGIAVFLTLILWIRLIVRRKHLETQLRDAAELDSLTGAANRYALLIHGAERLADPLRGAFSVIHLDLDDFKSINDRHGHAVGDAALRAFADACRSAVRDEIDIVARIGGDEFVILLSNLDDPEAETREVIGRVRARLDRPIELEGVRIVLPVSAGFAIATGPTSLQELLVESDLALMAAKERGKNGLEIFQQSLESSVVRELELAMDGGDLRCAFQPQFDMDSHEIIGLEALVRWQNPDRHHIEATKLIDAILWLGQSRRWLEIVMRDITLAWQQFGDSFEGRFWVNLTGRDLAEASGAELIEILSSSGVPLERVGTEITDPVLRADIPRTAAKLRELRAQRIAVALDDVGHDRVPLLHVTEFPIDVVKLDQCLVTGIEEQPELRHVVRSLASLCERLDLTVIAEGVETERQEAVLRRLGLRYVQGFRFSKAASLDGLTDLFRGHSGVSAMRATGVA